MNHSDTLGTSSLGRLSRNRLTVAAVAALSLAAAMTLGVRGGLVGALSHAHRGASLPGPQFSDPPTDDEFLRAGIFAQPLMTVGATTPEENRELAGLVVGYAEAIHDGEPDAVQPLADFVARRPQSAWAPGLELELGAIYRHTGHFSKALSTWQSGWDRSKDLTSPDGRVVGDMTAAYLSQFEAYLGRKELLAPLLEELQTRPVRGTAGELVSESARGLAEMQSRPDVSFKCGPSALAQILKHAPTNDAAASRRILMDAKSTPNGLSLTAVQAISVEAGMSYQMAHRSPGAPLMYPAVAHWNVGHYAALLGKDARGHLLVGDATFGEDIVLTPSTFDEEASGYFLVPPGPLPEGWRPVDAEEGSTVWGRGDTGQNHDKGATGRDEKQAFDNNLCGGCTSWNVEASVVGLELRDDPVGYKPPVGPKIRFPMTYSHRDTEQIPPMQYTNFGNKWTFDWLSYVVDGVEDFVGGIVSFGGYDIDEGPIKNANSYFSADLYRQGGGDEPYIFPTVSNTGLSFDGGPEINTTERSAIGQFSQAYLTRYVDANGHALYFTRTLPDGSVEKFTLAQGAKFFMTEIDDPQGNAVKINYDPQTMRITSVVDAAGQSTTICYNDSPAPCVAPNADVSPPSNLEVTQIVDPFGRSATFGYDPFSGHLTSITDVIGITSSFTYGAPPSSTPSPEDADFVNKLTTPYGTTTFAYSDSTKTTSTDSSRSLTATEVSALGNVPARTSRVEFHQGTGACYTIKSPTPTVLAGTYVDLNGIACNDQGLTTFAWTPIQVTNYLQYRNTFIWNPEQYAASYGTASQYSGAKLIQWLHTDDADTNAMTASRVPASIKEPLEMRVWFLYPEQGENEFNNQNTLAVGATNQPSEIWRYVSPGVAQTWQFQYDNYAHVTQSTDPLGRTLTMAYDPTNNVDLLSVTNTTPATKTSPAHRDLLLSLKDYVQHRPQQVTGANGQTTQLTYNAVGQLTSSTDPLNNTWTYGYTPTAGMPLPASCTAAPGADAGASSVQCGFLTSIVGPAVPVAASLGGGSVTPTYSLTYDNVGRLGTAEGPDGQLLTYSYDNADRLTQTLFPDTSTEVRSYTTAGGATMLDLQSFTDRAGYTTVRKYDGFRNLIEIDEPAGRTTTLTYWPDGTVDTVTDPLAHVTSYARDGQGRLTTITNPDGTTSWTAYDVLGRVVSTSPDQPATQRGSHWYAYNLDNTIAEAYLDWTAPTVFTYDPAYPRLQKWSRARGGSWTAPTATPTVCATQPCTPLDSESYAYYPVGTNGANELETVTTVTPGYSPTLGSSTATQRSTTVTQMYGYDATDRVTIKGLSTDTPGSPLSTAESFGYDALGRLASDTNLLDSFTYAYGDATARVAQRTSTGGPQIAAYYFPPAQDGLLQQLSYTTPTGAALGQFGYGYDVRHNVNSFSEGAVTNTYTNDPYSQLQTAAMGSSATVTAVPDLAGNLASLTTVIPSTGGSVPSSTSAVSFTYDAGNKMTQRTAATTGLIVSNVVQTVSTDTYGAIGAIGTGAGAQTFGYDNANRVSSYSSGSATSSAFLYDGLGRLYRVVDYAGSSEVADHSYVWCGKARCLEINNLNQMAVSGSTQTTAVPDALYVAQGAVNNPTTALLTSSQLAYDVTDQEGTEWGVVTNNAACPSRRTSTILSETELTTMGALTASNRGFTVVLTTIRRAGCSSRGTGSVAAARRRLARWMTRDPIGMEHAFDDPERFNATDHHLDAYAGNNPQSMVDPSGYCPTDNGWEISKKSMWAFGQPHRASAEDFE